MVRDLLIVGAGPVGLALALALRDAGLDLALVDARERGAARRDPRVLALSHGTRLTLQRLGVWPSLQTTPIVSIHVSQHGGFGRTRIEAREHDLPALGYVVAAGELAGALDDAVAAAGIPLIDRCRVEHCARARDHVTVRLDGVEPPSCEARLVACAEGAMPADDPSVSSHDYQQHAVIALATPQRAHQGLAYERFTAEGPLALLPCGNAYAVVHTAAPATADRLLTMAPEAYRHALEERMGGRIALTEVGPRQRFPLTLRYRRHPVGERMVWIGNAAQTLHPVAGQGFNLALRDVWALAAILRERPPPADPGAAELLAGYARSRILDRRGTIGMTDALVRLFSNDHPVLGGLRGAGLLALDACSPLRAALARRMMFGARAWP